MRQTLLLLVSLLLMSEVSLAAPIKGQDLPGRKCTRENSNGGSTFGECESVCRNRTVRRGAEGNTCQGGKA